MNWHPLPVVLDHYSDRLKAGAKADLLALAEITCVKSMTARVFWDHGYKSVGMVAAADVQDLVPILIEAHPRKLRLGVKDEEKFRAKLEVRARAIVESAGKVWERMVRDELEMEGEE